MHLARLLDPVALEVRRLAALVAAQTDEVAALLSRADEGNPQ